MTELVIVPTWELDADAMRTVLALIADVFEGELTESDWEHALGGVHALLWEGPDLIGHAALVQRRLLHRGRALRAGYVEAVGVRAEARRGGHASTMLTALEVAARGAYEIAALSSSALAVPFYVGRGWIRWRGPTWALTPTGIVRTEGDDDSTFVLPISAELDIDGDLTCDWRDGTVW